jgi:hypothetical protein
MLNCCIPSKFNTVDKSFWFYFHLYVPRRTILFCYICPIWICCMFCHTFQYPQLPYLGEGGFCQCLVIISYTKSESEAVGFCKYHQLRFTYQLQCYAIIILWFTNQYNILGDNWSNIWQGPIHMLVGLAMAY